MNTSPVVEKLTGKIEFSDVYTKNPALVLRGKYKKNTPNWHIDLGYDMTERLTSELFLKQYCSEPNPFIVYYKKSLEEKFVDFTIPVLYYFKFNQALTTICALIEDKLLVSNGLYVMQTEMIDRNILGIKKHDSSYYIDLMEKSDITTPYTVIAPYQM